MPGLDNNKTGNKTCLHLVATSHIEAMERCAAQFAGGDAVVFLDDGVMHLADPERVFQSLFADCHFLEPDLEARGLARVAEEVGVQTITDSEFVALLKHHQACLTWK